jgi:hypothetical protein
LNSAATSAAALCTDTVLLQRLSNVVDGKGVLDITELERSLLGGLSAACGLGPVPTERRPPGQLDGILA